MQAPQPRQLVSQRLVIRLPVRVDARGDVGGNGAGIMRQADQQRCMTLFEGEDIHARSVVQRYAALPDPL